MNKKSNCMATLSCAAVLAPRTHSLWGLCPMENVAPAPHAAHAALVTAAAAFARCFAAAETATSAAVLSPSVAAAAASACDVTPLILQLL